MADSKISTIVSVDTLCLVITDITTVPSASTFMMSPMGDVNVDSTVTFSF